MTPGPAPSPAPVRLAFAFTDIEGSTRLLERLGAAYAGVLGDHAAVIRSAIAAWGGREVDTQGDAFFAAFPDAGDALRFAVDVQRGLAAHPWPDGVTVRVRIGLHAGEAIPTRTGYVGMDVHHGARVAAAAHGGQVLCSGALAAAVADVRAAMGDAGDEETPDLVPLGSFALKDMREPVELLQAAAPGLDADFPPPRTLDAPDEPPAPGDPPYPGLVPFDEADAGRFFGRDALVADLVERLGRDGFLAVVGASGSGKSSLLRAGLVPAVRARLVAAGEPAPRVALLTPTEHPPAALDAALAPLDGPPHLVAVDQLEELATLCRDDAERDAFVARLLALHDGGTAVAVALRADLYATLAPHDRLRDLVAAHQAYPGPLAGDDLRAAIEGPAASGGWRLAPGLADLVIADLGEEPGALPLLAHALRETWERRRGTTLALRGYLDAGGVRGAIARSAERLADGLDDRELGATRAILLRLVRPGDEGPDTRRRAPVAELLGADPDPGLAAAVLDRLVAARLVVVDGPAAEVAHEALIREWPRLRGWLDADRDALRLHRAVTDAAADHARAGDDPSLLWRGARLEAALAWLVTHPSEATGAERAFLDASRAHEAAEIAEREALRQRELDAARRAADAERARADEAASANRRLRRRAVVLVGLLVVAIGLGGAAGLLGRQAEDNARMAAANEARAEERRMEAEEQSRIALSRQLAAQSETNRGDIDTSLLLGLEAGRVADTTEARGALLSAITADPRLSAFLGRDRQVHGLVFGPDGVTLRAASTADGAILEWTKLRGAPVEAGRIAELARDPGTFFAISPDGRLAADAVDPTTGAPPGIVVWDVATGEQRSLLSGEGFIRSIAFSPDGSRLAAGEDAAVGIWDTTRGERIGQVTASTPDAWPRELSFSEDGDRIAVVDWNGSLAVWDLSTSTERVLAPATEVGRASVAFGGSGSRIVSGADDGTVTLWDVASGEQIGEPVPIASGSVPFVALDPSGSVLTAASDDGVIHLWDLEQQAPTVDLTALKGESIQGMALAPDGQTLAAADFDGRIAAWDLRARVPIATELLRVASPVVTADVSPDERVLAMGMTDGTVARWDLETGALIGQPIMAHPPDPAAVTPTGVVRVRFSPDGRLLATSGGDGTIRRWDAVTGEAIGGLSVGHATEQVGDGTGGITGLAFTPDGSQVVSGGDDATIRFWDVRTGVQVGEALRADTPEAAGYWDGAESFSEYVNDLAVSPDGRTFASAGARSSVLWDLESRTQLGEPLGGHDTSVWGVAFSPDGSLLAATDMDGAVLLWDVARRLRIATLPHDGLAVDAVFDPSGKLLLVRTTNGLVLWDVAETRRIGEPMEAHSGGTTNAVFLSDGSLLTKGYLDGSVLRWDLDPASWRAIACEIAGRDLTPEEWATYLDDEPWRETCPADGDAGA